MDAGSTAVERMRITLLKHICARRFGDAYLDLQDVLQEVALDHSWQPVYQQADCLSKTEGADPSDASAVTTPQRNPLVR